MNTQTPILNAKALICSATLTVCALLSGPIYAKDVTVNITVSAAGIDLSEPAGARELYRRIKNAAYIACTHGQRVDLKPVSSVPRCLETAIGDAVGSINRPQLTLIYLATHTPQDAWSHGINLPVLAAAK